MGIALQVSRKKDQTSITFPSIEKELPQLVIRNQSLNALLRDLGNTPGVLFVSDPYNAQRVSKIGPTYVADSNDIAHVRNVMRNFDYQHLVGVGGCTALDIARVAAEPEKTVSLVPTIVSTSCISSDRGVVAVNNKNILFQTEIPASVYVSVPDMLSTPGTVLHKWNQSGLGDILANIGGAIDFTYRTTGKLDLKTVKGFAQLSFDSIEWFLRNFNDWNEESCTKLVQASHASSVSVVQRGDTQLSAGGEHRWYHRLMGDYPDLRKNGPTHGEIVFVGLLLEAAIFGQETGTLTLYRQLADFGDFIKLPTTYHELYEAGLTRDRMIAAMSALRGTHTILGAAFDCLEISDYALLDDILMKRL